MCGIIGAVTQRDVAPILLEGLKRLEYRGYDSAGMAVLNSDGELTCVKKAGKVSELANIIQQKKTTGGTGIAHTRWATHGEPNETNAHPHTAGDISVVHNGIIENYQALRQQLETTGHRFLSNTDSEVIAHLLQVEIEQGCSTFQAIQNTLPKLKGAYGIVILHRTDPKKIYAIRSGSPLVVGVGINEHFVASDRFALHPVTHRYIYLKENDIAEITQEKVTVTDLEGNILERSVVDCDIDHNAGEKGPYRHYMLKEIFEQPEKITDTLESCLTGDQLSISSFGKDAQQIFERTQAIQIVACGTSYHAGMVARYWFENLGIPCQSEIASEFRYRNPVVADNTLFITISQSGETADTLSALHKAKEIGYKYFLSICNVPESSIVRASDLSFLTKAGVEVGVASTKAFTTQLTALLLLATAIAKSKSKITIEKENTFISELKQLPKIIYSVLQLKEEIQHLSNCFSDKYHALFLGRGTLYPIAMEGALKLKEISYIHAEAYAAGELKHGPLALVDENIPVVVIAPNNELLNKLKSNMEEVQARGGKLYVFADRNANLTNGKNITIIPIDNVHPLLAPVVYTIPLQLLSYYVALIKGTDVDQPRNLAKSVTVE